MLFCRLSLICLSLICAAANMNARTICHVFIHGTSLIESSILLKSASFLTKIGVKQEQIDKFMHHERAKPKYAAREILLEEGLVEIAPDIIKDYLSNVRCYECDQRAAYPCIANFSRFLSNEKDTHIFYTFGWRGTLLQEARIQASKQLYAALGTLYDAHKKQDVAFNLYAHSHGGSVALLLAKEELVQQRRLQVEQLVLYGTPIQPETVQCIKEPVFRSIYNFYSRGDIIQKLDFFTSTAWRPSRCLSEYIDLETINNHCRHVADVQLLLNGDAKAVGHHNMWLYNKITHQLPRLSPLPLMVLTPLIIDVIKQTRKSHLCINIAGNKNHLAVYDIENNTSVKVLY